VAPRGGQHGRGVRVSSAFEHNVRQVMSGDARGPRASALRAAMSVAEVPYSLGSRLRNWAFDAGVRTPAKLPRPVISVGNITTGGTGKTPVVRWLAERLRASGERVAILSRGYKAKPGALGDEQRMLASLLDRPGEPPVVIRANPDRVAAGNDVLREHSDTSVFLLDDGFQHRRLARDFDLVLINATEPFGFGHVLPRGMLREPLRGLRRASAFLLTRADQADDAARAAILDTLKRFNPGAAVYESVHAPACFREADRADAIPLDALRDRKWFAFCGIGGPESFVRQLESLGGTRAGHRFFADHHDYKPADLAALKREASDCGAEVLVTTEKDWVKVAACPGSKALPACWRLDVEVKVGDDGEEELLAQIRSAVIPLNVTR
jgi:tetraacyldisaccharide 4'-kinase